MVELSKAGMFYKDLKEETIENKYVMWAECLKRNRLVSDISFSDKDILHEIEHMEI